MELETLKNTKNLDASVFKRLEKTVNNHVQHIEDIEIKISAVYDSFTVLVDQPTRKSDCEAIATYILATHQKLSVFERSLDSGATGVV